MTIAASRPGTPWRPEKVTPKYPSRPAATDYGVGMLPLTGRTVILSGHKVDGTPFTRTLANCSYVPARNGDHVVTGLDVGKGEVRTFRLRNVVTLRLRTGGPTFKGVDLVATIDHHLASGLPQVIQQVLVDEEAA